MQYDQRRATCASPPSSVEARTVHVFHEEHSVQNSPQSGMSETGQPKSEDY